ncbi:MAG TPA: hypothetical protein VF706_00330, partial [Solirubrobacteraceae bacterium]
MSAGRTPARVALAGAALALLVAAAVLLVVLRSPRAGADANARASRFVEPSVSPSCTPSRLNVSAALAGSRVTVSPEPDSRDASVSTQISMLGPPASELSHVTVVGAQSGAHPGRLAAYSQGDGASFVPSRPFTQGELVRVRVQLQIGAQTIPFAWSFTAAVQD